MAARLEIVARHRQHITAAPFAELCLVRLDAGTKRIGNGLQQDEIVAGDYLAVAPGQLLNVENLPGVDGYRAVCLYLPDHRVSVAPPSPGPAAGWMPLPAERGLAQAFVHVERGMAERIDERLLRHRVAELMEALALAGFHPPAPRERSLAERLRLLIGEQPAHDWRADEVAARFALSTATLRRRLAGEMHGFRTILEETRLAHGLALVQGSSMPLRQVAAACGYDSPSRFAARFRRRFGCTPSELRG